MKVRNAAAGCMAVFMAVSMTGCAGEGTERTNSGDGSQDAAQEINLAVWNEPHPDEALNMYMQCEKATGIKVNVTVIPQSDYSSKINQMVSTKDSSMDIYVVWENDIKNFANAGGIICLDDYLEDSEVRTDDFIDAVDKLSEGLGGTYGLPWGVAAEILYYNQDMFDAAGISYPTNDWSYEEFKDAAEKLTKKKEDGSTDVYGCALPNNQTWWAGVGGAGDEVYDPATGEMRIGEGAVSFVTDCAEMVENGVMPAPSSDTADLFAAGKAAMCWQGSWFTGTYGGDLPFNWDIASLPTNKVKYNTLHTGFYTINANSDKQDSAFKVIEYLMGEEGQEINSKASGNLSAIRDFAAQGAWKNENAVTVENWDAVTDSLECGVFGYTCLPSGVTANATSEFSAAVLGQKTPDEAVESAARYAEETIGY